MANYRGFVVAVSEMGVEYFLIGKGDRKVLTVLVPRS